MINRLASIRPGIKNIDDLRAHLQIAIELEHSTIPPYLCALYSIPDGMNVQAAQVIRSVVMEEMLHLTLAANILNAIGGSPDLDNPDFIPGYPTRLPDSSAHFKVHLERFSKRAIKTFMKLERPAKAGAMPEADNYQTIGQFYAAIEKGLKEICRHNRHFNRDRSIQVKPEHYYGGGGGVIVVDDLDSAMEAIKVIVAQGEGLDHTLFDGDRKIFGENREFAHYYRFNEIRRERFYSDHDSVKSNPSGAPLTVDWDQVYPMKINPRAADYPEGSELRRKSDEFNVGYTTLLKNLHDTFNGRPDWMMKSVGDMYKLKYLAVELMRVPCNDKGETAGPAFEYQKAE
ncbi:MAG: ferritin-like protein [Acidobacteria bacterium]|nr:ferritin-like protein [Acidobacteriota bacterium]